MDKAVKKTQRGLRKLQAQLGVLCQEGDTDTHLHKKAELLEHIQEIQAQIEHERAQRKRLKRTVTIESLPEEQRPT